MGVNVLTCFPWYSRRKERSKITKGQSLQGSVTTLASVRQIKPGAVDNCAYFSEKARVSFRHELNSPTSVINSTN
ncbi:uncharacterized protein C17orf114-like [Pristis pectinata]|uniref:uncharacterized protein C17orf114-like n=1 Tax=Pristis pectinata TaxID=685728 RepID=UPI00223E530E|nr:uncharacterized protein C17orf114-like [Pristis pectinata]